ncbi:MAG: hypothetical protein NTU53_23065 [Planctomycetota bacterium]|nr:hypothetical protein [Planctomycetota bacterium]
MEKLPLGEVAEFADDLKRFGERVVRESCRALKIPPNAVACWPAGADWPIFVDERRAYCPHCGRGFRYMGPLHHHLDWEHKDKATANAIPYGAKLAELFLAGTRAEAIRRQMNATGNDGAPPAKGRRTKLESGDGEV